MSLKGQDHYSYTQHSLGKVNRAPQYMHVYSYVASFKLLAMM